MPLAFLLVVLLLLVDSLHFVFARLLLLRLLPISFHAIVLTVSPVITILWSLLLFAERPSLRGLLGGAAVLPGVLVVTLKRHAPAVVQSSRLRLLKEATN
jgi:drug/metabolite transporter (DMT)-like permease